jgi:hypothetical protein
MERIKQALKNGNVLSIEFSADGSSVSFYFKYRNERYNEIETQQITIRTGEAVEILRGYRLTQHKLTTCF